MTSVFCEQCHHTKASKCIELRCKCCIKADKIRLGHPVFGEGEEEEEKSSDEKYWEGRRDAWMTDMGGLVGSGLAVDVTH